MDTNLLQKEATLALRKVRYFDALSYRYREGNRYFRKTKSQLRLVNKLRRKANDNHQAAVYI